MGFWKMIGLIPASGKASRFKGLPKFSLPCDVDNKPLIKRQVDQMSFYVDEIVVCTTSEWEQLIKSFKLNAEIMIIEPSTMNDAVIKMANKYDSENYIVAMADTYFYGENPYLKLSKYTKENLITVACWKINDSIKGKVGQVELVKNSITDIKDKDPNCDYEHMWGALGLNKEIINKLNKYNAHLGIDLEFQIVDNFDKHYAFEIDGTYFDLGTLSQYRDLLNRLEL
jgi:GTP:adenosylcobinamide-phosphate guanylyltransferase